ncbi:MAG: NAD(P)-binding domain-containing protein, partial [Paracoccus sp. (in: a-proteobacteria)]|uniref:NAD(P)-binding domain-containing protein n=1 Tax=Paracoccus sp. TaxID=267 RepID=UPI003242D2F2
MDLPSDYRVCVVGLGSMGMGAALSCLRAGLATSGIDLDAGRRDAFAAQGAEGVAEGIGGLTGDFNAVIVLVVNGAQARQVILGQGGVADRIAPGGAIMVSCTQSADDARTLGADLAARGILMLDAPVSGGAAKAAQGAMTVMASGPDAAFDALAP